MNKRGVGVFLGAVVFYGLHDILAERLGFVANSGVSFGIDLPLWINMFVLTAVGLYIFVKKNYSLWLFWWGALGNMIDRLRFGVVRDYWQLDLWGLNNNINDWCIFIGIIIFVYHEIWLERKLR